MADNAKNKNTRPISEDYSNTKVFLNASLDKVKEISEELKNVLEEIGLNGDAEWFKENSAEIRHKAWQLNDLLFDIKKLSVCFKAYVVKCKN